MFINTISNWYQLGIVDGTTELMGRLVVFNDLRAVSIVVLRIGIT